MEQGTAGLGGALKSIMIDKVPSYANKFFYSLGFLSATSFMLLLISGIVLIARGPMWWLSNPIGIYARSVHLWSTQAFVLFVILHMLVVFFTYAYRKPRQLTWVLGGLMLFVVLFEAEFGYLLRGDFSSQWRSLQASDLYNGSGLGHWINNLNYTQVYGIHIAILPLFLAAVLGLHYLLVRRQGIATPHREDIPHTEVKANHGLLFMRGVVLTVVVLLLSTFFKSPLIDPVSVKTIANNEPALMAQTLMAEMDRSSDTATYVDNIAPYKYDTREVYVYEPYRQVFMVQPEGTKNWLDIFLGEPVEQQDSQIAAASDYFKADDVVLTSNAVDGNPLIPIISAIVPMGQSGLYEANLRAQTSDGYNPTFATRFMADTGVLEDQATSLGITTEQYGMMREESGHLPGAWWLAPVGWLDHTVLKNDDNQDQHGAEILGLLILLFLAFPYIPYVNRIADKLSVYKLIWKEKK